MIDFGPHLAVWSVAGIATAGVIFRPWKVPEAVWATAGAAVVVTFGLLPAASALDAVARGLDVYLFLGGMMLLTEMARNEGVFEFLATAAVRMARGSNRKLFLLVYAIGAIVTVFMSNDATAVVLTPAVCAAARKAGAKPLPHLIACALIANAASFVLPISNPANLVLFVNHPPPLLDWLGRFGVASLVSVVTTFTVLRFMFRRPLSERIATVGGLPPLSPSGVVVAWGIGMVAAALLVSSNLGLPLGLTTLCATALVAAWVFTAKQQAPWYTIGRLPFDVLLLVAALFVLVQAVEGTGVVTDLAKALNAVATGNQAAAAVGAGALVGLATNLMNNLPAGLFASAVLQTADAGPLVHNAVLIGIDMGPNLSVTGSLATILWLIAVRREGVEIGAWQFMKIGMVAMPVPLILALGSLLIW